MNLNVSKLIDAVNQFSAERKKGTKGVALVIVGLTLLVNYAANDPYLHALIISRATHLVAAYPWGASLVGLCSLLWALFHDSYKQEQSNNETKPQ